MKLIKLKAQYRKLHVLAIIGIKVWNYLTKLKRDYAHGEEARKFIAAIDYIARQQALKLEFLGLGKYNQTSLQKEAIAVTLNRRYKSLSIVESK